MMKPIQLQRSLTDESHEVQLSVRLTQTIMRTRSEDQPILGGFLGLTTDPSIRIEDIRFGIGFGIVKRWPKGWDHH